MIEHASFDQLLTYIYAAADKKTDSLTPLRANLRILSEALWGHVMYTVPNGFLEFLRLEQRGFKVIPAVGLLHSSSVTWGHGQVLDSLPALDLMGFSADEAYSYGELRRAGVDLDRSARMIGIQEVKQVLLSYALLPHPVVELSYGILLPETRDWLRENGVDVQPFFAGVKITLPVDRYRP